MVEFWLAFAGNLQGALAPVAAVVGIVTLGLGICWAVSADLAGKSWSDEEDENRAASFKHLFRRFAFALPVCVVLACVPTLDNLWSVRIALIKYELASPQNVKSATATIERIGKKLECKYLGGNGCEAAPESNP